MATYSFMTVNATLTGLGGMVSLGYGAASAKDGISYDPLEEKDRMDVGADGAIMHSLRASNAARITVRLLKTSPVNAVLNAMYHIQRLTVSGWGINTLVVSDVYRGDIVSGDSIAFSRHPVITWAEDANRNEWTFFGNVIPILGAGVPDINI
jgi:hypothetical protein